MKAYTTYLREKGDRIGMIQWAYTPDNKVRYASVVKSDNDDSDIKTMRTICEARLNNSLEASAPIVVSYDEYYGKYPGLASLLNEFGIKKIGFEQDIEKLKARVDNLKKYLGLNE